MTKKFPAPAFQRRLAEGVSAQQRWEVSGRLNVAAKVKIDVAQDYCGFGQRDLHEGVVLLRIELILLLPVTDGQLAFGPQAMRDRSQQHVAGQVRREFIMMPPRLLPAVSPLPSPMGNKCCPSPMPVSDCLEPCPGRWSFARRQWTSWA